MRRGAGCLDKPEEIGDGDLLGPGYDEALPGRRSMSAFSSRMRPPIVFRVVHRDLQRPGDDVLLSNKAGSHVKAATGGVCLQRRRIRSSLIKVTLAFCSVT
jgi:hypothetical protein